MDTRRFASPVPGTPGRRVSALVIALALSPLPASAQYMALTVPPQPAAPRAADPEPRKPLPPTARPSVHAFNGQLPNQRTGTGRQRVVRDICIGCDR